MSMITATVDRQELPAVNLPLVPEDEVRTLLGSVLTPNGTPVAWSEGYEVVAFTDDPAHAVLAANALALHELGDPYATVAGGGVEVDGPHKVVLVGGLDSETVDYRPAEAGDPYALQVCLVRPTRGGAA